jgi:hypothetical protein
MTTARTRESSFFIFFSSLKIFTGGKTGFIITVPQFLLNKLLTSESILVHPRKSKGKD